MNEEWLRFRGATPVFLNVHVTEILPYIIANRKNRGRTTWLSLSIHIQKRRWEHLTPTAECHFLQNSMIHYRKDVRGSSEAWHR